MSASLSFVADPSTVDGAPVRVFVGRRSRLLADDVRARVPAELTDLWEGIVRDLEPGDDGRATTTWTTQGKVKIGVLPERCSRHNTPTRAWSMPALLKVGGAKDVGIVIAVDEAPHAWAAAMAVATAYPAYSATSKKKGKRSVSVLCLAPEPVPDPVRLAVVAEGRRRAARFVDAPPNQLNTLQLVEAARDIADDVGAKITVIQGEDLNERGFGGLWGVGRASENPPALVILEYAPSGARGPSLGWVGKGITYDTGGLSIKSKTGMVGMKTDLGGAAAVLGAFWATARLGLPRKVTAAICIAENSIGPRATRPDDVLEMYSGRTVEVNNTDAEGRLVLADGVAFLSKHHHCDVMVDVATLTGAQLVATGKRHAALYCSSEALERRAVDIGRQTGDLVHAMPFVPEFYRKEFRSNVADLRNSVKDRANAQASCAGQFVFEHLRGYEGDWLHVDMAGPAFSGGRGTGYGVGLLLGLAGLLG